VFSKESRTNFAITFQRRILLVPYMAILCPFWAPFVVWAYFQPESRTVQRCALGAIVFCVIVSWWCAHFAGYYMAVEFQSFRIATGRALVPLFARLAFLPVIGPTLKRIVAGNPDPKSKRFVRKDPFARDDDE